jgi:hypothetical protein
LYCEAAAASCGQLELNHSAAPEAQLANAQVNIKALPCCLQADYGANEQLQCQLQCVLAEAWAPAEKPSAQHTTL